MVPVECQAAVYTHTSTFTSTFDGWGVPPNNPTGSLVRLPGEDGGPPSGTVQSLDTQVGSPTPGSAKLEVPFAGFGEQLLFGQNYPTPLNLSGSMITAQMTRNPGSRLFGDVGGPGVRRDRIDVRLHLCDRPGGQPGARRGLDDRQRECGRATGPPGGPQPLRRPRDRHRGPDGQRGDVSARGPPHRHHRHRASGGEV